MSSEWQPVTNNRKRRRSERKSGKKRQVRVLQDIHEVTASDSESVDLGSLSSTINVLRETDDILNSSMMSNSLLGGLPGTNMVPVGTETTLTDSCAVSTAGTSNTVTGLQPTQTNGSTINPNIPLSNQFSSLDQPSHSFGSQSNMSHGVGGANNSFNPSERVLGDMGVTDSSTALILSEIQSMRQGLYNDLTQHFNTQLGKMYKDICAGYDRRFKTLEDRVSAVEEENSKLRRELDNVSVTGSLEGEALEQVVQNAVDRVISEKRVVTKSDFDIDTTIAAIGIRYSADEDIQEKAEQLVHQGLGLTGMKVVRAKRTFNSQTNRAGLVKVEFESENDKKEALRHAGRLRSWSVLGYNIVIRSSQTFEHRTHADNFRTLLKGNQLEGEYFVNKNGRVLPRPGSLAAANVLASSQNARMPYNNQGSQGNNQVFGPQAPIGQQGNAYRNNPVYGPPTSSYSPRPRSDYAPTAPNIRFGPPSAYSNTASYAAAASQTPRGSQNVNPLSQFMAPS